MSLTGYVSNPSLESRILHVLVVVSVFFFTFKSCIACLVYDGSRGTVDKRSCGSQSAISALCQTLHCKPTKRKTQTQPEALPFVLETVLCSVSKLLRICRRVVPEAGETWGGCCHLQETPGEKSRELCLLPGPGKSSETKWVLWPSAYSRWYIYIFVTTL